MRRLHTAALAAALVALAPQASAAEAKLKFLLAWDDRLSATPIVGYAYAKNIEAASGGEIEFSYSGPEVVRSRQQFQPMSRGVFDLNLSTPVYYMGTTAVLFAFYALPPAPGKIRSSGLWAFADEDLERFGQNLVAVPGGGTKCDQFQILMKRPFDPKNELKGVKLRANAFYKQIVEPMGGAMVNLDAPEVYAALQRGVVDGVAWPKIGMINFKWYEVAKFMVRPAFGCSVYSLAMNLDRFRKLSKAHREVILDEGRKLERSALVAFDAKSAEEVAVLVENGVKETHIDPTRFDALVRARNKGLWDLAASFKGSTDQVNAARAIARAHGLAE